MLLDSNGTFTQTGGDVLVVTEASAANAMNSALDVDGTVTMSGGTIVDENGETIKATQFGGGMMSGGNQTGTMPDNGQGSMRPGGNGGNIPDDFEGMSPEDFEPGGFGSRDEQANNESTDVL